MSLEFICALLGFRFQNKERKDNWFAVRTKGGASDGLSDHFPQVWSFCPQSIVTAGLTVSLFEGHKPDPILPFSASQTLRRFLGQLLPERTRSSNNKLTPCSMLFPRINIMMRSKSERFQLTYLVHIFQSDMCTASAVFASLPMIPKIAQRNLQQPPTQIAIVVLDACDRLLQL
jgi:hypothetical protein